MSLKVNPTNKTKKKKKKEIKVRFVLIDLDASHFVPPYRDLSGEFQRTASVHPRVGRSMK
jgi:hypothetical protein